MKIFIHKIYTGAIPSKPMVNTPNHNYNTPEEGTTDWHIPINENFEQLDIDVEIRGPEAEKGTYEPTVGSKYEATDSGAVYYGNGNSWVLVDRRVNTLEAKTVSTRQLQANGPRLVSPSISAGYDSLQTAIDEAAQGGSAEIWVAENIQENVFIPTVNVNWNNGLTIRGVSGRKTKIKDDAQNGTPIIEVEKNGGFVGLTLESLNIIPSGNKTRAFSYSPKEAGHARGPSLAFLTIRDCRFEAPTVIGLSFFTYLENSVFRSNVKHDYDFDADPVAENISGVQELSTAMMFRGGNQHVFNRCNWVTKTGDTRFGALWVSAAASQHYTMCHFNLGRVPGSTGDYPEPFYDTESDREVGALLIDGCRDMMFETPYCEVPGDYAVVQDSIINDNRRTRGLSMYNSRLHSMRLNDGVNGLVIEGPQMGFELNLEKGLAGAGGYIRETISEVTIVGENSRFLRVYRKRQKGWEIQQPSPPVNTGERGDRRNDRSQPILIYQSGAEGTVIEDFHGNTRTLPDDSGPILLGLNERIWYETSTPDEWIWYGME